MDKQEIVKEYCRLSATVAGDVFKSRHAADCFCGEREKQLGDFGVRFWNYAYEDAVLEYIREAVYARMKSESIKITPVI